MSHTHKTQLISIHPQPHQGPGYPSRTSNQQLLYAINTTRNYRATLLWNPKLESVTSLAVTSRKQTSISPKVVTCLFLMFKMLYKLNEYYEMSFFLLWFHNKGLTHIRHVLYHWATSLSPWDTSLLLVCKYLLPDYVLLFTFPFF